MAVDKRWRLVCYDIREPARWRKVYKIVRGRGRRVQYSVFRCRLDNIEVEQLRWELAQVMAPDDALLIVDLCPSCARNVISRNHVEGWQDQPATFRVIGSPSRPSHGPVNVEAVDQDERAEALEISDEHPDVATE